MSNIIQKKDSKYLIIFTLMAGFVLFFSSIEMVSMLSLIFNGELIQGIVTSEKLCSGGKVPTAIVQFSLKNGTTIEFNSGQNAVYYPIGKGVEVYYDIDNLQKPSFFLQHCQEKVKARVKNINLYLVPFGFFVFSLFLTVLGLYGLYKYNNSTNS